MNPKNIEALRVALTGAPTPLGPLPSSMALGFAAYLASRGVLVPSALTDEECLSVEDAGECFPEEDDKAARAIRWELERIAKGET